AATGWRSEPAGANGRSGPRDRVPYSAQRSCSRSCARCRTRDRPRSSLRRPAAERQTAGARPLPNTPSTASTPPPKGERVLPMCPVRSVTYVSGRSQQGRRSLPPHGLPGAHVAGAVELFVQGAIVITGDSAATLFVVGPGRV